MIRSFKMENGYPLEAEQAKKEGWAVLLPVGTMEYHSTHTQCGGATCYLDKNCMCG